MIRQHFHIREPYDWDVTCYYAVTHYEVDEILISMRKAGAKRTSLDRAYENLSAGNMNTGLCYSGDHRSVLVISVTSSSKQFFNSIFHEVHHLATHIATVTGYDLKGEEVCYLAGEIAENMYPIVGHYLCDCCRQKRHDD
ncbi:MAG: hypothetical protein NC548_18410 [Lachnospiraceae bacterium]|nr:hypothetical protein [Lachnospiraceae bacterium]